MRIAIPKERLPYEHRVAATPDAVRKYVRQGFEVVVESGAGEGSAYTDEAYRQAGATVAPTPEETLKGSQVVLKVRRPMGQGEGGPDEIGLLEPGAVLIAMLEPYQNLDRLGWLASRGVTSFGLELVPRITRAQAMDVLSSQANLAGYRAVLDAAFEFGRAFPMMMTAAGTVPPAKVMVMGAGVAGLQAIATARRLGAVVCATDVRPVAKEQVESLGATFVMVESEETRSAETAGGYAREMSAEYQAKQAELIAQTVQKQDIVICTAQIPGKPAPRLLSQAMVESMKPGSVIIDLAVESGGNCELSKAGEVVQHHGVKVVGWRNVPSRIAVDASALYARNVQSFLGLLCKEGTALAIDTADEIIAASLLTRDGAVVHPGFAPRTSNDVTVQA